MMLVALAGAVLEVITAILYAWIIADAGVLEYRWDFENWLLVGIIALPALSALVAVVAGILRRRGGYWAIAVFGLFGTLANILQLVIDPLYPWWIAGVVGGLAGLLLVFAGVRGATTAQSEPTTAP